MVKSRQLQLSEIRVFADRIKDESIRNLLDARAKERISKQREEAHKARERYYKERISRFYVPHQHRVIDVDDDNARNLYTSPPLDDQIVVLGRVRDGDTQIDEHERYQEYAVRDNDTIFEV